MRMRVAVRRMSDVMGCRSFPMRSSARTPTATVTSTVISPRVSNPRKSTRITFTTLRPCPSVAALSVKYGESRDVVPEAPMKSTSTAMIVPAAVAMTASRTLTSGEDKSPNPLS